MWSAITDYVIQEKIQIETNQQGKKHALLGKEILLVLEFFDLEEEKKC